MGNRLVVEHNPPPQVVHTLNARQRCAVGSKIKELGAEPLSTNDLTMALTMTFPSFAERIDGERVEAICRGMVAKRQLKEL